MTTDITELAQSLKAAAEKASNGDWVKESGDGWEACCSANDQANGGFIIAHFVGPDAAENREFVQAANPANVLALVEALEKAQATEAHCNRGWIEAHEQEARAEAAEQRIAELESRTVTVKLPLPRRKTADDYVDDTFEPCDLAAVYNACRLECEVKFKNALAAAGIKVEAEMKTRIVLQELKEDGVLTTYSNGHVEMLPYRIDENGEEYVEMFPNDIELH
ncbi:TPA: ead/Ea22-like family protein [Klebsiella variicola]|uniref:ead/Ea22-like family protein n=1 Tax=Klebsiella variicola TaxID=244366 RepID=UPI002245CB50|nr:ead/Ea22-like family protein [Klebsiella variicola]MCW9234136.1 ead/Ea22-like family protein [Klebsiella variicola]